MKKLEDIKQSVTVLAARSGRNINGGKIRIYDDKEYLGLIRWRLQDASAARLALRLDGLPLALATAGVYLSQSADSFDDYLELYNNSWSDLSQYNRGRVDYEERNPIFDMECVIPADPGPGSCCGGASEIDSIPG